jgi:hypothetical protein
MGFVNPILGGGGALVRPAIKSPNYVPGTTGWEIDRDGNAEFNDGDFRGTVTAAQIIGSVISSSTTDPSIWINEDDSNSLRVYDASGDLLLELGANNGSMASAVFYDRVNPLALSIGEQIQWLRGPGVLTQLAALYQKGTSILFNSILSGGIGWDVPHGAFVPLVPGSDNFDTWHAPTPGTGWALGPGAGGQYPPLQWHADTQDRTQVFGVFHATSTTPGPVIASGFPLVNQTGLGGVGVAGAAVKTSASATTIGCYLNSAGELRYSGLPATVAVNDTFMINALVPRGNTV